MTENYRDYLIKLLAKFPKEKVIITEHAKIRLIQRQINIKEIIGNIINPQRLEYAIKQKAIST